MPAEALFPLTQTDSLSALWGLVRKMAAQASDRASVAPLWLPSDGFPPDVFTISGSTDVSHTLTYLPLGLNGVWLNGAALSYGNDFGIDWSSGVLTLVDAPVTGDLLEVWYVTNGVHISSTTVLVDWLSTGWLYDVVLATDTTDRSATAFDDSGFSTGQAGFGAGLPWLDSGVGWGPFNTTWDSTAPGTQRSLWLRRHFGSIDSGTLVVRVRVDNYAVVYWNGTEILDAVNPSGGALPERTVEVPSGLIDPTTNVLAVKADNSGDDPDARSAIDVRVELRA